ACGDLYVDLAADPLPASAVAGRTGLAGDVAAALAGRTRLLDLPPEGLARFVERLLRRNLGPPLEVLSTSSSAPSAGAPTDGVFESAAATARAGGRATPEVDEDRAKKLGEVAGVAILDREPARLLAGGAARLVGVALPIRTEGVVA